LHSKLHFTSQRSHRYWKFEDNNNKEAKFNKTFFFTIKPTRCTNFTNLFWHETLHVSDSSSVHHQEFIYCTLSNGICHTGLRTAFEQDQDGTAVPSWSCSKAVWHIPLLSVRWINSWWWREELAKTCGVSCQNKFVKLVHLVGFIIKKFVMMRGHTNVKFNKTLDVNLNSIHLTNTIKFDTASIILCYILRLSTASNNHRYYQLKLQNLIVKVITSASIKYIKIWSPLNYRPPNHSICYNMQEKPLPISTNKCPRCFNCTLLHLVSSYKQSI